MNMFLRQLNNRVLKADGDDTGAAPAAPATAGPDGFDRAAEPDWGEMSKAMEADLGDSLDDAIAAPAVETPKTETPPAPAAKPAETPPAAPPPASVTPPAPAAPAQA